MLANRSNHMARSKDQLKRQLLMGISKKSQPTRRPEKIKFTQIDPNIAKSYPQKSSDNSYSILDEFSKCPYSESEQDSFRMGVLNMFMQSQHQNKKNTNYHLYSQHTKKITTKAQTSVQTIGKFQSYIGGISSPNAVDKGQTFSTIHPISKTPIKRAEDKNDEKSLIDVSKNLSNCKYIPSNTKEEFEEKILTESILKSQKKDGFHEKDDTAIKKSKKDSNYFEKFESEGKKNDENEQTLNKPPIVKKIQLSVRKTQENNNTVDPNKNVGIVEKNQPNFLEEDTDQELERIISKKSSIKDLIKQKSSSSIKNIKEEKASKWNKPNERVMNKNNVLDESSESNERNSDEILNLFPPYESSSSKLEAVIQEENQSLEESVQLKRNNQKIEQLKNKKQVSVVKSFKKPSSLERTSELKEISLSDLSFEDVSQIQIQNRSEDKNFMNKSSLKKIPSQKKEVNKNLQEKEDEDLELKRYICNDIGGDINGLRKKIQSQFSQSQYSDIFQTFKEDEKSKGSSSKINSLIEKKTTSNPNPKNLPKKQQISSQNQGSEGVARKQSSMLDFIQKLNAQFDFQDISKDIQELKNKMESESSGF